MGEELPRYIVRELKTPVPDERIFLGGGVYAFLDDKEINIGKIVSAEKVEKSIWFTIQLKYMYSRVWFKTKIYVDEFLNSIFIDPK
jgi:hypothetical protein